MGLIDDLRANIDDVLSVRDDLGAGLATVFLVTREWTGDEKGDGTATETKVQMLPSPRIVKLFNDRKARIGGEADTADIKLKMISRESYASKTDVDCSSTDGSIEKFYEVDGELYRVIEVEAKHVTWNVTLRKQTDQQRWPEPAPEEP